MAFNFNWSPLTADASFYTRAKELLTAALNKSPKPPIIVDDILVNELNLGSVPPHLEILEIGDLAEDRFRGIFKMCYSGDAFLTLKTRVQANPLNTYLSTTPSFTSPAPLAASSGLTIPLQITLSDFKLSAFIILVFSRQKGLTLVFRNDPLESLKVSSTFDSIPFVRDYLQKEIEGQLRTLLMDDLPAIIHRLSLRLWVREYQGRGDKGAAANPENTAIEELVTDPLASPPQDPVDMFENSLNLEQIASLSLDSSIEAHDLFSQKNLVRLAALSDSHRTLSLFTPSIRDVVYRVWAGPTERGENFGVASPPSRTFSGSSLKHTNNSSVSTTYTFSASPDSASSVTRPAFSSYSSAASGMNMGSKHGKPGRRRKHRVVNLRKTKNGNDGTESIISGEDSMSVATSSAASEAGFPSSNYEGELVTPPGSPKGQQQAQRSPEKMVLSDSPSRLMDMTPRPPPRTEQRTVETKPAPSSVSISIPEPQFSSAAPRRPELRPSRYFASYQYPSEKPQPGPSSSLSNNSPPPFLASPFPYAESSPGGILEQAWMMKMAGEIARRVQEQKRGNDGPWDRDDREPPPAYGY